MQKNQFYSLFQQLKANQQTGFAVLVDPDKISPEKATELAGLCNEAAVDFLFWGGSIVCNFQIKECIETFKSHSDIPVILFPGNPSQIADNADALLYLSVISGRNPEQLIGQHVTSAPLVKQSGLEILSTGYMIIDGGRPTTVSYISGSLPIPSDKPDIALCTAWAGEMLGNKLIYMDAGSGAIQPVHADMIHKVASNIEIPLIVGGGIRTPENAVASAEAGAQVIVVGNAIEKDPQLIKSIGFALKGRAEI